jgi:hypothetical protein
MRGSKLGNNLITVFNSICVPRAVIHSLKRFGYGFQMYFRKDMYTIRSVFPRELRVVDLTSIVTGPEGA